MLSKRVSTSARRILSAAVICAPALFWPGVAARADVPKSVINTPLMQSLLNAPGMHEGIAAFRRGDGRTALRCLRPEAGRGNDIAQVMLAVMYYRGMGVPRNYRETLQLAAAVLSKKRQPTFAIAEELLDRISKEMKRSNDPQDRDMGMAAAVLALGAAVPKGAFSGGHSDLGTAMMEHYFLEQMFGD